jgi:hypothetical protein
MWPFRETNAAAMRALKLAGLRRRVSLTEPLHCSQFYDGGGGTGKSAVAH